MLKRLVYISLSLVWMIVIFSFSAKNADSSGSDSMFITERILRLFCENPTQEFIDIFETVIRKIAHFTEYAVLSVLYYLSLRSFGCSAKTSAFAVGLSFLYAISDEIHQYFVPGRACRWYDVVIDTAGGAVGYWISASLSRRKKR